MKRFLMSVALTTAHWLLGLGLWLDNRKYGFSTACTYGAAAIALGLRQLNEAGIEEVVAILAAENGGPEEAP